MDPGAREFLIRLEQHPEVDLLGAICQSPGQSLRTVAADLWRRRGVLALPLLVAKLLSPVGRVATGPRRELRLRREMRRLEPRIRYVPDIHGPEVLAGLRELRPDLGLIYGAPILKPKLFEIPRFGTLGIHHGKLPEYRGKKTTFWAMFNGEATAGVTIQRVNAGLDTGEIVHAGEVPIGRAPLRAVWRRLESLGLDLYMRAVLEVMRGEATYEPSRGRKGKLYRDPTPGQILEFWRRYCMRLLRGF